MTKKRILVTGAAGFVGSHFIEHVVKNNPEWEVVALVRTGNAGDLHRLGDNEVIRKSKNPVKLVYHDLNCPIPEYISQRIGVVDYVVHFAANSHVDRSITNPVPFFYDAVIGTVNLLEWCRKGGLKSEVDGGRFINFGTDEQFGPAPDDYNFKEDDRWRPSNPYSASKVGQAAAGYSYYVTFKIPVISTQTMNIFGERQNPEKLIPRTMQRVLRGQPMTIHCKIDEVTKEVSEIGQRHWLHVRNVASAVCYILEHGKVGEFYNVVGFDEFTNLEIAELVAKALGKELKVDYVDFHRARPGHDRRYALDGGKLAALGWKPPVKFEDSLKKCVEWTMEHPEWLEGGAI